MSKLDEIADEAIDEAMDEGYAGTGIDTTLVKKKKKKKLRDADGNIIRPAAMPAGHQRDEAMKVVADALEEEGEENLSERFRLDPSKFVVENEIGSKATSLNVSGAQDDRAYCWARFRCENGVSQVEHKRSLTIGVREIATGKTWKEQIWHVVQGKDPEALELKQPDGTRRLGDVLLLWAKREVYEAVVAAAAKAREALYGAPQRAAKEFEQRTGIKIVTEAEMADDPRFQKAAKHAEGHRRGNLQEQARVAEQLKRQRGGRAA